MSVSREIIDVVIPVYNDSKYLNETLISLLKQILPKGWKINIIIVDDGSEYPVILEKNISQLHQVTLVRLEKNQGRGRACNIGAETGDGELIYFIDVDCILRNKYTIMSHFECISQVSAAVSCGQICCRGDGFWSRYQMQVALRRERSYLEGNHASLTSANFMIKRDVFNLIGGFDKSFSYYGFEDRDLFLSIIEKKFHIFFCQKALVEHVSELSLASITNKLKNAGRYSSLVFKEKHPEYYQNSMYSSLDFSGKRGISSLAFILGPFLFILSHGFDLLEKSNLMPFFIGRYIVKIVSGLGYMQGTIQSSKSR